MLCILNSLVLNKGHDHDKLIMTKYTLEKRTHRAVAPVIATLLMVAIAVVGGTIIFVFAQGFFSQSQISGTPTIEAIKILGYDARDVASLNVHDGGATADISSDSSVIDKNVDERITVFVKNDSVNTVLFTEIRLGGTVYLYANDALTDHDAVTPAPDTTQYAVLTAADTILAEDAAILQPGQTATLLLQLSDSYPIGRDTQFKLTTTNGAIFVGTVVMGQNSG